MYDSIVHDILEMPSRELFRLKLLLIVLGNLGTAAQNSFQTFNVVQFEQVKNRSSYHCYVEKRC